MFEELIPWGGTFSWFWILLLVNILFPSLLKLRLLFKSLLDFLEIANIGLKWLVIWLLFPLAVIFVWILPNYNYTLHLLWLRFFVFDSSRRLIFFLSFFSVHLLVLLCSKDFNIFFFESLDWGFLARFEREIRELLRNSLFCCQWVLFLFLSVIGTLLSSYILENLFVSSLNINEIIYFTLYSCHFWSEPTFRSGTSFCSLLKTAGTVISFISLGFDNFNSFDVFSWRVGSTLVFS